MNSLVFDTPSIDWQVLMPLIIVSVGGILGLIFEMFAPRKANTSIVVVCLASLLCAGFWLARDLSLAAPAIDTFNGMAYRDNLGLLLQSLLVGICFLTVVISQPYMKAKRIPFGEFYPLVLWSTVGAMIMVSTKSLLMLFIGLEVLSIALYVMAGLSKSEQRSEEAAIKYLLLGAFGSAFLLFGIAYIFGATGSIHLDDVAAAATSSLEMVRVPMLFGVAMMLVGLGFKAALVPFHQWAPDVYQGAPTNVTGYMATASKIAAIGALIRLLDAVAPQFAIWYPALAVSAGLTMVIGNIAALIQTDVKRMLGFSSIANAGYLMVGILGHMANPDKFSNSSVVFFLAAYSVMTLGVFTVLTLAAKDGREPTTFSDLNGLYQREPFAAIALSFFAASLIGVPPLAGFFGKLLIFQDALGAGLAPLAILMAIMSVVSAFYYIGLLRAAFVADTSPDALPSTKLSLTVRFACVICLVGVIVLSILIAPISESFNSKPTEVSKLVRS